MAALGGSCALILLFSFLKLSETIATTVEVTVPIHPLTVGGILAIQCHIQNMEDDYTVRMFRAINGRTEHLTTEMIYFPSSVEQQGEQRLFVSKRTMPGGILVYFMTIVNLSYDDEGEYLCRVYTLSGGDYVKVTEGSTNVEIYFLPNRIYPQCQSEPVLTENMNEGVQLKLKCISSRGSPEVALRWVDNLNQEIFSTTKNQDDTVSSEINVRTATSRHGLIFICEMSSPGFPGFKRTCKIGPITIKEKMERKKPPIIQPVIPMDPVETIKGNIITTNECTKCSSENKYTILYLSMATVAASILCMVFLTTTIIWCYKYHNISSEITNPQQRRNITSYDGSEPVYVSLQARQEPDRNSLYSAPDRRSIYKEPDKSSTYMSVEDPNNPGSKVLMPKEVFEEFYNSLRLKRV